MSYNLLTVDSCISFVGCFLPKEFKILTIDIFFKCTLLEIKIKTKNSSNYNSSANKVYCNSKHILQSGYYVNSPIG